MDPLTMMLLSSGTQTALGAYQMIQSQSQLNKLKRTPIPSLLEPQALDPFKRNVNLANQQFQRGLSPITRGIAEQSAAATSASQYRQATDMSGGQLSSVIGRIGAMGQYQTASNLAQMDVAERGRGRSALMQANAALGSIYQQDVQQRLNRRMQLEQSLGTAKSQGRENIAGAAGALGQYAMYESSYGSPKTKKPNVNVTFGEVTPDNSIG
jgi:hypothetical protein